MEERERRSANSPQKVTTEKNSVKSHYTNRRFKRRCFYLQEERRIAMRTTTIRLHYDERLSSEILCHPEVFDVNCTICTSEDSMTGARLAKDIAKEAFRKFKEKIEEREQENGKLSD
jgi:hypothetical protein